MAATGFMSRVKDLFGAGSGYPKTVAAATTVYVPDGLAWVNLTGTATITSLQAALGSRNRLVYFYQSDSGSTTFTHTASASTANQMDLGGSNIVLASKDSLLLYLKSNGVWQVVTHTQANSSSTSIASGSPTVADTGDIFTISGSSTITAFTSTAPTEGFRRLTFIGAASASVTFQNSNSPTSGQMYLQGADRLIREDDVIVLIQKTDGTFTMESYTG